MIYKNRQVVKAVCAHFQWVEIKVNLMIYNRFFGSIEKYFINLTNIFDHVIITL